jgi:hypothetical protein
MPAMTDQPIRLTTARFILHSLRFCFLRCFSTRSACSGVKSEDIRVAVLSSSAYTSAQAKMRSSRVRTPLLGFKSEYVTGTVTKAVRVTMK